MRLTRTLVLFGVAILALSHQSDGQQARPLAEQVRLSGVMPRGAMVYLQVRDLAALMSRWTASSTRNAFYNSASYKRFEQSNIFLKFQDRKADFEKAIGFGVEESRLAELAGGASAVALYDIGKLELVFVTEVGREKAIATVLFKNSRQFEERSAKGSPYFVREVTTDGGRLKQQFCFAYADGKLLVTTTEGLMLRALENLKAAGDDSALNDVLSVANLARGFVARDATLWVDQAKLNQNRHFKNYWLYGNWGEKSEDSLAGIESGLIDLRFAPDGWNEQRWFKVAGNASATALTGEQAAAYLRFVPRQTHLVELHGSADGVSEAAALALVGRDFAEAYEPGEFEAESSSDSAESESSASRRAERYSRLDARFDRDVDDEQSKNNPAATAYQKTGPAARRPSAATRLEPILKSAASYMTLARGRSEVGKPFVRFERAVVLEVKTPLDKEQLERFVSNEIRERFLVAGINPQLAWQEEGGVRYLGQTLIEQGAAYAISGNYLIVASSREYAREILAAVAAPATAAMRADGTGEYFAMVRVAEARPVFDRLMTKLDGKPATPAAPKPEEESEGREVKFFSDNLSSFLAATSVREVRLRRVREGALLTERLTYSW